MLSTFLLIWPKVFERCQHITFESLGIIVTVSCIISVLSIGKVTLTCHRNLVYLIVVQQDVRELFLFELDLKLLLVVFKFRRIVTLGGLKEL